MANRTSEGFARILYGAESTNAPQPIRNNSAAQTHSSVVSAGSSTDASDEKTAEASVKADSNRSESWKPSVLQPRPLAGLAGLAVAVGCVFASLGVLLGSRGKPVESWAVQPTVYLAIIAAFANSALRFAKAQAAPISWWYHVSRGGTIRALERHFKIMQGLIPAIFYLRCPSLLNVSTIAMSFIIIDGALLQRASTVIVGEVTTNVTLNLSLSPELPTGFSGYSTHHALSPSRATEDVIYDWTTHASIEIDAPQCKGSCRANILAPGLQQVDCTSQIWHINRTMFMSADAQWGSWKSNSTTYGIPVTQLSALEVSLSGSEQLGDYSGREWVSLTVGQLRVENLEGDYTQKTCTYWPSVMEVPVVIQDGKVSLPENQQSWRFVSFANNTDPASVAKDPEQGRPNTLTAFTAFFAPFVSANASVGISTQSPGVPYAIIPASMNSEAMHSYLTSTSRGAGVDVQFADPTPRIIAKYNDLMFRGAVKAASMQDTQEKIDPSVSVEQTVQAEQTVRGPVYHVDLHWYAGAAIFELAAVLLVLILFHGWWNLNKSMTLSPMEIALAFNSPLLSDVNSASGAKGVVEKLGGMKVKFGSVKDAGRLGVAYSESVKRPYKGERFTR